MTDLSGLPYTWRFSPLSPLPWRFNCAVPWSQPGARLVLSCHPHSLSNRLHEAEEGAEPLLSAFSFQRLLSNLTALRLRVSRGPVRGGWLHKTSPGGPNWAGTGDMEETSGPLGQEGL